MRPLGNRPEMKQEKRDIPQPFRALPAGDFGIAVIDGTSSTGPSQGWRVSGSADASSSAPANRTATTLRTTSRQVNQRYEASQDHAENLKEKLPASQAVITQWQREQKRWKRQSTASS